jgi:hypothetical protein
MHVWIVRVYARLACEGFTVAPLAREGFSPRGLRGFVHAWFVRVQARLVCEGSTTPGL